MENHALCRMPFFTRMQNWGAQLPFYYHARGLHAYLCIVEIIHSWTTPYFIRLIHQGIPPRLSEPKLFVAEEWCLPSDR